MLTLRTLTSDEFPLMVKHGEAFFHEYEGFLESREFNGKHFLESMQSMALWFNLTVFGLWDEDYFVGGLAAFLQPDLLGISKAARDVFIYIEPRYRGGLNAKRLMDAYHTWARAEGATYAYMVHLEHGPLREKFVGMFESYGYQKMETAYRLDLRKAV